MKKKISLLAVFTALLVALLTPGLLKAQNELIVVDSSAQVVFPLQLSFSLSAESNVDITDVRLHYRVERQSFAPVTSEIFVEFEPAPSISLNWALEMVRIGGLPPGTSVEYWWTVTDARQQKVSTTPATVKFEDRRYQWQSLTEGKVTLYWYQGNEAFAQELMTATQQSLVQLKDYTGAELLKPIELYIYANSQDFQGSMLFPQEWAGGVAFTHYGIMAISISPNNLSWGKHAIIHELTHLVIKQVTLNPYNDLPTWLNEGLATYSEGSLETNLTTSLNSAIALERFISVQSLASPFSVYPEEALLSYAQSYSLVEFLILN